MHPGNLQNASLQQLPRLNKTFVWTLNSPSIPDIPSAVSVFFCPVLWIYSIWRLLNYFKLFCYTKITFLNFSVILLTFYRGITLQQTHYIRYKILCFNRWQREARIREIGGRLQGEVAYYAPCGKKLRQYPEVMKVIYSVNSNTNYMVESDVDTKVIKVVLVDYCWSC